MRGRSEGIWMLLALVVLGLPVVLLVLTLVIGVLRAVLT